MHVPKKARNGVAHIIKSVMHNTSPQTVFIRTGQIDFERF